MNFTRVTGRPLLMLHVPRTVVRYYLYNCRSLETLLCVSRSNLEHGESINIMSNETFR